MTFNYRSHAERLGSRRVVAGDPPPRLKGSPRTGPTGQEVLLSCDHTVKVASGPTPIAVRCRECKWALRHTKGEGEA